MSSPESHGAVRAVTLAGGPPEPTRLVEAVRLDLFVALAYASGYGAVTLIFFGDRTQDLFPWQTTPLTAGTIGSAYAGALVMAVVASRCRQWASVRAIVPSVAIATIGVTAASVAEHGALRLDGGPAVAYVASYLWFLVHAGLIVLLLVGLAKQPRPRGADPRGRHPMPRPVRLPAQLAGLAQVAAGAALVLLPHHAGWWPWPLAPIDARVIGAWSLALGVGLLGSITEADLWRIAPGAAATAVTGILALVTLARHPVGAISAGLVIYVSVLLVSTAVGVTGLVMGGPWRSRTA